MSPLPQKNLQDCTLAKNIDWLAKKIILMRNDGPVCILFLIKYILLFMFLRCGGQIVAPIKVSSV